MAFNTIKEVLRDLQKGKQVIIIDDKHRENEGDLVMAAEFVKPASINFMARYGRGLICAPCDSKRLDELDLHSMVDLKEDRFNTAWAISIDAREGITTGISAHDRARTIRLLTEKKAKPVDFVRPGHVFPLRARTGGVLERPGHTEACIDLLRLAKMKSVGIICEIMNEDGSMARKPNLLKFAKKHRLKIATISDLIDYRIKNEKLISRVTETKLPTSYGEFKLIAFGSLLDKHHHIALIYGDGHFTKNESVPVRIHSECLTGDVFGSARCDCGWQLDESIKRIVDHGKGVIVYMRQEGRGIGIMNKLKAYALQDLGLDTVEANEILGFKADLRDYGMSAQILKNIGVYKINLITNNPRKIESMNKFGLKVNKTISIEIEPNKNNSKYLKTKKTKLGHKLVNV